MMDEKTELVVSFLNRIWTALEKEPMFAATNEEQRAEARYTYVICMRYDNTPYLKNLVLKFDSCTF